jgi:hypothetical protein
MAGRKQGTPGEKQPGTAQLFGKGTTVDNLLAGIQRFARSRGITDMRVATDRYMEYQAVKKRHNRAGYARGVANAEVFLIDTPPWPKDAIEP